MKYTNIHVNVLIKSIDNYNATACLDVKRFWSSESCVETSFSKCDEEYTPFRHSPAFVKNECVQWATVSNFTEISSIKINQIHLKNLPIASVPNNLSFPVNLLIICPFFCYH